MMLPLIPFSAVGIRHNNHHANRRTPKLILLYEIFSTLLQGKPIQGIIDYKQQQMLYHAGCIRLRTLIYWRGCGKREVSSIQRSFLHIRLKTKKNNGT